MSDWLDAEAHADRGLEWFERGRWNEAEAELRKAIALNPDQPEWHYNLGLTLEAAGRDSEALATYEHAIHLMPGQIEPLLAAGITCNRLGRFGLAIRRFEQALRLDRRFEAVYAHKMESHLRLFDHEEVEATFYLAELELRRSSPHCLAVLAESLMQRRAYERAEWCLKQALRLEPAMPRLRARLGAVLAATDRPQRALQLYLRELRDDPGNIDTLLDYGELLLDLGRLPDASEKFRRVLELEPANVDAHHCLGRIAMVSNRFEEANLEFELVLKLDPTFPRARLDIAEALLRRGRRQAARQVLQQELEQLHAIEQGDRAAPGNEPVVRRDYDDPAYFRRLGDRLLEADWNTSAAGMYHRAIRLGDVSPDIHRNLALAYFRGGDTARGVAASRRVLRLDPACVRSVHNLALAALEAGRLEIAGGWVARGMKIDRHDVGVRRLRMRLWSALVRRSLRRLVGLA
jgi:tetratricopeptide (TPR) repeat protein